MPQPSEDKPSPNRSWTSLAIALGLSLGLGCSDADRVERAEEDSEDGSMETEDPPLVELEDEDELLAQLLEYRSQLEKFGAGPEESETHADAAQVEIWGTPDVRTLFETIDPMDPSQFVEFEPGVTFVKEHFSEDGTMFGINVMFKGPEGYDPEHGDWVWLLSRDDEPMQFGRLEFCQDCHSAARNSDFVVGFGKSE